MGYGAAMVMARHPAHLAKKQRAHSARLCRLSSTVLAAFIVFTALVGLALGRAHRTNQHT